MILKTTNHRYNIGPDGRASYDIVDQKNQKLFTVETVESEGYRYQELCCTDTVIDKVTAHFDTKGEDAVVVMHQLIRESQKDFNTKMDLLEIQNTRLKRQADSKWQETCLAARLLVKNNLKEPAKKLVKDYLQNQK